MRVHSGDRAALLGGFVSQSVEKESVTQVTHLLSGGCTGCFKINYAVKFISSDRSYQDGAATDIFNNMTRRGEKL